MIDFNFDYNYVVLIVPPVVLLLVIMLISKLNKSSDSFDEYGNINSENDEVLSDAKINMAIEKLEQNLLVNDKNQKDLNAIINLLFKQKKYAEIIPYARNLISLIDSGLVSSTAIAFNANLALGVALLRTNRPKDAYGFLVFAEKSQPNRQDLLLLLGECEYLQGNYSRADIIMRRSVNMFPDNIEAKKIYGLVLYEIGQYSDAINYISYGFNIENKDPEICLKLGISYLMTKNASLALKLFLYIKSDTVYGAKACLEAGRIYVTEKQYKKAIQIFQLGIGSKEVSEDLMIELKYCLAQVYIKNGDNAEALDTLKQVKAMNPNYKNVEVDINNLFDFLENKHFATYLNSDQPEFIDLCQKMLNQIFDTKKFVINNILSGGDHICDFLVSTKDKTLGENVYVRFFRAIDTSISDLQLRDLHNCMKEHFASSCMALCPAVFSELALEFIEGRPINIVDKTKLLSLLLRVK